MDSAVRSGPRGRWVIVTDEDPAVVGMVIRTLREDGHIVFHAFDSLSAVGLAAHFGRCDLLISDARVGGTVDVDLLWALRSARPQLPMLYVANLGRSTLAIERALPDQVPILRQPFTVAELRAVVARLFGADGRDDRTMVTAQLTAADDQLHPAIVRDGLGPSAGT